MDRALLADFLRARREALQPEEVGLPRGARRRTGGLRREEVAVLAGMSADYYSRLEQKRGPMPSEQILAAVARALRLSPSEREHLFALGGHAAPRRALPDDRVGLAIRTIAERLSDTPAIVFSRFGEALLQTPAAVTLFGDHTRFDGLSRYLVYRWFTDPAQRVDVTHHHDLTRYRHPALGELELYSRRLVEPDEGQGLLVFMAEPGSPSEAKLRRLITMTDGEA
jgi:transcriptional regulator with XRE-family HTH domain